MNNFEKTSAQTPENAPTNTFWQAISKLPFAKQAMFIASFSALVGCGGEKGGDPTPEPYKDTEKPKITATAVVVSDLDGDGVKDDASFNVKATDNKGIKSLDVFVNGAKQNVEENGDVKVLNLPTGTIPRAITVIDTSNNKKEQTDTFQVTDAPNQAPTVTITPTLTQVGEHAPVGTEIATFTATDPEGEALAKVLVAGDQHLEIQGNKILTKTALDYETIQSLQYKIKATDPQNANGTDQKTLEITDQDDIVQEAVDRPDVTYYKNDAIGGEQVTEDLSYLDNANTKPAEQIIDKANNNPNQQNLIHQLRVNTDNNPNTTEWANKQDIINMVKNTGLGDGLSLDVADRYAGANYGAKGFNRTTDEEYNANNEALLKNQHNEILHGPTFRKSVRILKDQWGAEDDMFLRRPSYWASDANKLRTARMVQTYLTECSKTFNQAGGNQAQNLETFIAETMSKIESMTNSQLRQYQINTYTDDASFVSWWGN